VRQTIGLGDRGFEFEVFKTVSFPKVIMRESEVVHSTAIAPVLHLLQRPAFRNVNSEFLNALEDYRKGEYGDSLTKCGSSFESFLKVLCSRKKWPHKDTDTAGPLVEVVLGNVSLAARRGPAASRRS